VGFGTAPAVTHGMLRKMNFSDSSHSTGTRLGAAVAVSLAVLLAAGCGSSKSSGTKNAASGSATTSAGGSSATSSGSVDGGASPSAAGSGSGSATSSSLAPKPSSPGAGGPRDCSTDMLSFSIQALREPINHVMIAAKNTTQVPCHLNKFPLLRTFQAEKTAIGAADATKPASVILLAPGATAYAGVMTSSADGSGTAGKSVAALVLQLQPNDSAAGGVGRPTSVPMPATAQYVDSSAVVTYWESDMQSATY
jgi:hypothetical protein